MGHIETGKQKFYQYKVLLHLEDVDVNNVLVSYKISSGKKICKYFIGYLSDDYKIETWLIIHTMVPKTRSYAKS